MRLAILYRLAIPLLLALASATVIFRMLLLLALVLTFAGFLFLVTRITGDRAGRIRQKAEGSKKFIDGSYRIVDDDGKPHK